jgi:uncharacterized protein YkwD
MQFFARVLAVASVLVAVFVWAPLGARGQEITSGHVSVYMPIILQQSLRAEEQEVVELTNQIRRENGCEPFRVSPQLGKAARDHSEDMATRNYFDHTSPDGLDLWTRMRSAGYRFTLAAENIAAGQPSPDEVVQDWMESPGHRENILNCALTEIGVGYASNTSSRYGVYWTENFGTPIR